MAKKKAAPRRKKAAAKKAAPRRSASPAAILESYQAGASLEELKKKYGLRGKSQLATAVFDALIKAGKLPPLQKVVPKTGANAKNVTVSVNKRGTIILPKDAVIGSFGSKVGQPYTIKKRGNKIILTAKG